MKNPYVKAALKAVGFLFSAVAMLEGINLLTKLVGNEAALILLSVGLSFLTLFFTFLAEQREEL